MFTGVDCIAPPPIEAQGDGQGSENIMAVIVSCPSPGIVRFGVRPSSVLLGISGRTPPPCPRPNTSSSTLPTRCSFLAHSWRGDRAQGVHEESASGAPWPVAKRSGPRIPIKCRARVSRADACRSERPADAPHASSREPRSNSGLLRDGS